MGSLQTKDKINPNAKIIEGLKYKIRHLQDEVSEIMCIRENESHTYQQEMIILALKEAGWKKERKTLEEEVNKLKNMLEDKEKEEEKLKGVENDCVMISKKSAKESHMLMTSSLLEQIREEQVSRDGAIEKWKQLYFAIKVELDELIQRTNQGARLCWRTEEMELLEELHGELKAKEEVIAHLKERIASMEQQEVKMGREVDILRQSLRIMSFNKKKSSLSKGLSKSNKL